VGATLAVRLAEDVAWTSSNSSSLLHLTGWWSSFNNFLPKLTLCLPWQYYDIQCASRTCCHTACPDVSVTGSTQNCKNIGLFPGKHDCFVDEVLSHHPQV
jgi:hypothetical protein